MARELVMCMDGVRAQKHRPATYGAAGRSIPAGFEEQCATNDKNSQAPGERILTKTRKSASVSRGLYPPLEGRVV